MDEEPNKYRKFFEEDNFKDSPKEQQEIELTSKERKEAIKTIAKKMEENFPSALFRRNANHDYEFQIPILRDTPASKAVISIKNNKLSFGGWDYPVLLPKNIEALELEYGMENIKVALKEAHKSYINEAFQEYIDHLKYEDNDELEDSDELSELKEKITHRINLAIEAQLKQKELFKEMKEQNLRVEINSAPHEVERFNEQKIEAQALLVELAKLEVGLPKEPVLLNKGKIKVISVGEQLEQLKEDLEFEERRLKNLNEVISKQELKKPKVDFANIWKRNLNKLEKQRADLEEEIRNMRNKDYSTLYKKCYFSIPTKQNSDMEKLVKNLKPIEGEPSKIFEGLKDQLSEIIKSKLPEAVIKLYEEYKEFEKQLS